MLETWTPAVFSVMGLDRLAELPDDSFEPFTVEVWMSWWLPELCLDWPAPDRYEPVLSPETTSIAVPALILAGEQDNVVPNHVMRNLVDIFPNATWAPIEGAIHSVMGWSSCPRDLVSAFIATLNVVGEMCAGVE